MRSFPKTDLWVLPERHILKDWLQKSNFLRNLLSGLSLSGYVHNSSLIAPYNVTKSPPEKWERYIFHTVASITSLEECAAFCEITVVSSYTCNIFSFVGDTCYLANHNKTQSPNVNGPAGVQEIYVPPGTTIHVQGLARVCVQVHTTLGA